MLASLLLNVNTLVSKERLVAALWEDPPVSAVSNLQTHISLLRKALPPGTRLLTTEAGYVLEARPDEVDLITFEQEVRLARAEVKQGDVLAAVKRFESALSLWRGSPAEGTPLAGSMLARVADLEERLVDVRLDWAEANLALGMHGEVIGDLRLLVADQPLRERAWHLLVLALARAGQRGNALEAYRRARSVLVDELGIEPSKELQRLQADILADGPPATSPKPWQRICQLPADIADFVGRVDELSAVAGALRSRADHTAPSIALLTGPPGIGKSTLAVHAAHLLRDDFAHGQIFLRLSGTSPREPATVLAEVLRSLQVDGADIPDSVEGRAAMYRTLLADRSVLVILDDAVDEWQVRFLLPGTSRSAVLVTSRGPLSLLPGVTRIPLGTPSEADMQKLLGGIAGEARVRAEPEAARTILMACGRLPLAIRIAGARLATRPVWPLRELAARLAGARTLDELTVGRTDIRMSVGSSCELLPDLARRAFRLFGLLELDSVKEWTMAALLGATPREAEAALEALAAAGLVTANEIDQSGQSRYRMHDLVRVFAHECVSADELTDERRAATQRFVTECVARTRAATLDFPPPMVPLPEPPQHPEHGHLGATWLSAERETLLVATALASSETAAELAFRLMPFLVMNGFHRQAVRLLEDIAERTSDQRVSALAQLALADIALDRRRYQTAQPMFQTLYDSFEKAGDFPAAAYALSGLGSCHFLGGQHDTALAQLEEASSRFEAMGDINGLLSSLIGACGVHLHRREHQEVVRVCGQALRLAGEHRYGEHRLRFIRALGMSSYQEGDTESAILHYEESLALSRSLGWGPGERHTLRRLGEAYGAVGRYIDAVAVLSQSAQMSAAAADSHAEALAAYTFGEISLRRAQPQEALMHFTRCLDRMDEQEQPIWRARALRMIGAAQAELGDRAAARTAWLSSHRLFEKLDAAEAAEVKELLSAGE